MAQAFVSERIITPEGESAAAILVEQGRIRAVCRPAEIPAHYRIRNFGRFAILPGLVDSHVHINEPGRTEWEGFWTGTRAAAAGGYTTLVDMPLNCLPETTTNNALEAKRAAARGQCRISRALGSPCLSTQNCRDQSMQLYRHFSMRTGAVTRHI